MPRNDRGTRVGLFSARVSVAFPQSRMAHEWYIDANGEIEGPMSFGELRVRAADGTLQPEHRVSSDSKYWVNANSLPDLSFPVSAEPTEANGIPPRPKSQRPLVETVVSAASQLHDSGFVESEPYSPLDSIPGYEIQGTLGTGACGVVFRALQKKLDRVLALKTVKMSANTPPEVLSRFNQEAVSLARLQHPNIVSVYDCGHTQGRAYFAMELLEGEDLSQRLDKSGPLDERTAWLIARQTAAALDHAAKLGVVHRDIKPANLFLVPPPTGFPLPTGVPMVKVTDFGLALTRGVTDQAEQRQTSPGLILGTPVYMAPEQFAGPDVDARADIYSLGATVYQVLTNTIPFDGKTVWDVMMKKSVAAPRLRAEFSEATADLVAAMLAVDAKDRPQNYSELIARIDALPCLDGAFGTGGFPVALPKARQQTQIPSAVTATPPKRGNRKLVLAGVTLLVLLGVAAGVVALSRTRTGNTTNPANNPPSKSASQGNQSQYLYDGGSVRNWIGQGWAVEDDHENKPVLVGNTTVARALPAYTNFRVMIGLSLHEAKTVEMTIGTTAGNPATQFVVRLDATDGATFAKRTNAGSLETLGKPVPVPNAKERIDAMKTPYREVRYARTGNTLTAWFDNKLLGSITHESLQTSEFRLEITGGNIRIESAEIEELGEQK